MGDPRLNRTAPLSLNMRPLPRPAVSPLPESPESAEDTPELAFRIENETQSHAQAPYRTALSFPEGASSPNLNFYDPAYNPIEAQWGSQPPISLPTGPLNGTQLLLLSLREELQRLHHEVGMAPHTSTPQNTTETLDEQILFNASDMVEQLLDTQQEVPANLLQDLTQLVTTAREAGGEGLQAAFQSLSDLGEQVGDASAEITGTTSNLQSLVNALGGASAPNVVGPANSILSTYIAGSNAAVGALPPLPFPLTMPVPVNTSLPGGGSLNIPAGSSLSYDPATGYTITGSGLNMTQGGTSINAGTGQIQLGQNIDQLNLNSLNITHDDTSFDLQNAQIQIDKNRGTSQISADSMDINLSNGQVSMQNAQIVQGSNFLTGQASDLAVSGDDFDFSANQVNFGQFSGDDGSLTTGAQLSGLQASSDGTLISADQLSFVLNESADGSSELLMNGSNISVNSGNNQLSMDNALLNIQNNADGSSLTSFATENGAWSNGQDSITTSAAGFQIQQGSDGQIDRITALASDLNYSNGSDTLNITEGALTLNYGDDGLLTQAHAELGQLDWANGESWAQASEISAQANFNGEQLQNLQLSAGQIQYGNDSGELTVNGGSLALNFDDAGALHNANFSGDSIAYLGHNESGDPMNLNVGAFEGALTPNADGGQTLNVQAQDIQAQLGSNSVSVENIEQFEVVTNGDGVIESFNLDAPDATQIQTESLQTTLNGVNINYSEGQLSAGIESLEGSLTQEGGLNGQFSATGTQLWDTDNYTSVHIDSAHADFAHLGEEYGLSVESLDLVLDKGELGQLTGGELRFGDLEASLQGYTITGTNAAGQQTVLSFGLDDSGEFVQNLALDIPEGGQMTVNQGDDWFLSLGEQQQFALEYDRENGRFSASAHNLNAQYFSEDFNIDVGGLNGNPAELQISATAEGGIVIDNIENLSGKITLNNMEGLGPVEVDIDQIRGYSTQNLSLETTNNGMMLHLRPDGPDSSITAEVRTSYNGIPLGVSFDNVHELSAGFEMETNRANVYIGDPSGRGHIEIQAGPLKLEGSEIQVEAQYHTFDTRRMLNALDKLGSDNGIRLFGDAVTLDPVRGKLQLDTSNDAGPYLQGNFMFSSPLRFALDQAGAAGVEHPFGIRDDAFGFTLGTGARWRDGNGTRHQLGLDVGLLPGSYASIDVQKGRASLAGIPLPNHMTLGTTAYGGLNYMQRSDMHRFGIHAGVFTNAGGHIQSALGDQPFFQEDVNTTWGTSLGLRYQRGNTSLNLQYMGNGAEWGDMMGGERNWDHNVSIGISHSF